MAKNMFFVLITLLFGCATPKWQLSSPLDYLPGTLPLANSVDTSIHLEHNFNVTKNWGFVMNGRRTGSIYSGLSFSGATSNNFINFQLMFMISNDYIGFIEIDVVDAPKELQWFTQIKTVAKIRVNNWSKDYILTPAITTPLVRFQMKFGFGSEANILASVELRTGMAYDVYFRYKHADYYVSLFDGTEKKMSLPTGVTDNGFISHITAININLWLIHLEASLILNANECKTVLGAGFSF